MWTRLCSLCPECVFDSILSVVFQSVQVAWRPLVEKAGPATMVCVVQESVGASQASEDKLVNCAATATSAPTAQVQQRHTCRCRGSS